MPLITQKEKESSVFAKYSEPSRKSETFFKNIRQKESNNAQSSKSIHWTTITNDAPRESAEASFLQHVHETFFA